MYNAIKLYRAAHWLWLHHVPLLPKLITLLIFLMYNSKIHYSTEIGRGTTLAYGGMSVLIHNRCKIGKNCSIGVHAVLGGVITGIPACQHLATMYASRPMPSCMAA